MNLEQANPDDLHSVFLYLGMLLALDYMQKITGTEEAKSKLMATEIMAGDRGLSRLAAASALSILLDEEFEKAGSMEKYNDSPEDTLGKTITALCGLGERVLRRMADSLENKRKKADLKGTESPLDQSGVSFEDLVKDLPVIEDDGQDTPLKDQN